ncbi:putative Glycosyl hydrolase family 32 domain protein [metagenome]|uniref:Putative Glycosyl hydrolase family 32 domain protein n=1 Tax=metagenome TaxID=256318 RepID=A0A2P2C387_9ZZZZ
MLDLADHWVWDFWLADDGVDYHAFFLQAPRSLGDPELRHANASIGHAVSSDLSSWTVLPTVIAPGPAGSFDDLSTWTGSVVRDRAGRWWLFHTGITQELGFRLQRIGMGTSDDLRHWYGDGVVCTADPRFYDTLSGGQPEEHWRDPWVVQDERGLWHMYVTARAGEQPGSGVVGHATSGDLRSWTVLPPLSRPTGRFDWLEVISVLEVEGRWVALFSCLADHMPHDEPGSGGIWSVPVDGPGAHVDVAGAVRLTSEDLYVGKVVALRDGGYRFLAFENRGPDGSFVGGIIDPLLVTWRADGAGLELVDAPSGWKG